MIAATRFLSSILAPPCAGDGLGVTILCLGGRVLVNCGATISMREVADGAADFVHDSRAALHEDLWPEARAIGDGLGRAARMGGAEPARHLQDADHPRGCAEFADDPLPVPIAAVLPRGHV